jgi:two-component system LytT family response regulator
MIRALIIEDEQQARAALRYELANNCPTVHILGEASDVRSGIEAIQEHRPDLIFLDIQLTDGLGFQVLEQTQDIPYRIIFTTAFSDYALKAIKFSALDYLLKPVDGEELRLAVEKTGQHQHANYQKQLDNFLSHQKKENIQKRIALTTSEGIHLYELKHIVRCSSEGNYTRFFFADGKKLMIAKTLKELEDLLCQYNFERIHKSHIINLDHLVSYINKDNGYVLLSDQSTIAIAQRKKAKLLSILNAFNI